MRNLLSILAVCDVFVRSRFEKDFCQAGEANIQNYVPAPIIFLGSNCFEGADAERLVSNTMLNTNQVHYLI